MTQQEFQNIILKSITNLDIKHLNKLKADDMYSRTHNYILIENKINSLIETIKSKEISKLKVFLHKKENKFSVLTSDMLFIAKYTINHVQDNCFTIEECVDDIPF